MSPPRTGRHDRDHIVATALVLLDEVGLADLTMRRLAAELDVQPSALYWHIRSKQELLAAVADRILDRVQVPANASPTVEDRLHAAAHGIRDALLAYRDGAEVVLSTEALRLGSSRALDLLTSALLSADGGSDETAVAAAEAALQFILGHTTLVQQRMHAESHGAAADDVDDTTPDRVFETGIRLLARGFSPVAGRRA